jgi:hypothetical protein
MLLKANYGPEEIQPHPSLLQCIVMFDANDQALLRVQELDTETLVGKLPDGSAINVDHFGWIPSTMEAYQTLLQHLPRGYHYLVQVPFPEVSCAKSRC